MLYKKCNNICYELLDQLRILKQAAYYVTMDPLIKQYNYMNYNILFSYTLRQKYLL